MIQRRVSIAQMLIVVGFFGLGFAALKADTEPWAGAVATITMILLGLGLAGALLRRGRRQVFWVGFAIFGWGYWLLIFGVSPVSTTWATWIAPGQPGASNAPRLITTQFLEWVQSFLMRPITPSVNSEVSVQWGSAGSYWPATLVAYGSGQVQIRWKNYPPGNEEWVAMNRLKAMTPDYFTTTGQALFAILAALLGGLLARVAFGNGREDP